MKVLQKSSHRAIFSLIVFILLVASLVAWFHGMVAALTAAIVLVCMFSFVGLLVLTGHWIANGDF